MANNVISFDGIHGNAYDLYIGLSGQLWNGAAFASVTTAGWTLFAIAGTEQDTTGRFQWTMPAAIAANPGYDFTIRQRLSTNAAPTDPVDGQDTISWDGTNLGIAIPSGGSVGTVTGNVNGTVILASNGMDSVILEPTAGSQPAINARQGMSLVFNAACYGILNNANGSPSTISNPAGTITRATITQDQFGNRTVIQFNNLP